MRVLRVAHHAVVSAWRARERALIAKGHEVRLLSARAWNEGGRLVTLEPGADTFVEGARTWGRHPNGFLYSPLALWRALGERSDVIDIHEEPYAFATAQVLATRWLRRVRTPYLLYSAQNVDKRYPWPVRSWERSALRGAAGAYVCNTEAGRILRAKGLRGPVRLVPLGVDLAELSPVDRRPPGDHVTVGYVGRLEAHKGVDVLLHAVALDPGLTLIISGDGPERDHLGALARTLGCHDRVTFAGFAQGPELTDRYRAIDVLAVPSLDTPGWREQFGRVAVEAMACAVPVVARDSGALPDVVGGVGSLVPPGSPAALATAIREISDPERWTAARERGLARARECSWERIARDTTELYREAVSPAHSRDLHALVVAYGAPDGLDVALAALGPSIPAVVVDNSSDPRTRDVCDRHGAHYVDAGSNLGFAAGVNRGLAELSALGRSGDVLLLNPDAVVAAEGVRSMHEVLLADPALAAVGARQVDPVSGEAARVWWPFPTPWGAVVEAAGLGSLRRAHGFAIGSVLLLRAEALEALGGMDERFFLYAEETDWQRRARDAAWKVDVADVPATHVGAGTGGDPGRREAHFYGSAERYVRKHHGAVGWQLYRLANVAGAALRSAVLTGDRRASAARRRRIFATGPIAWESAWR